MPGMDMPPELKPKRWPFIVGGVVVAAVVVALVLPAKESDKKDEKAATKTTATTVRAVPPKRVTVDATVSYNDTGIDVKKGELIAITATGEATHGGLGGPTGPEGDPEPNLRQFNVVEGVNHNGIIGKIGDTGEPFFIGAKRNFRAPATGRLFLGVNDTGVANNTGAYQATVRVGS
jgi:hypothetical protein